MKKSQLSRITNVFSRFVASALSISLLIPFNAPLAWADPSPFTACISSEFSAEALAPAAAEAVTPLDQVVAASNDREGSNLLRIGLASQGSGLETIRFFRTHDTTPKQGVISLFVRHSYEFRLERDGHTMYGSFIELDGNKFMQIGGRWISIPVEPTSVQYKDLLESELQLGNPELCDFLGLLTPDADVAIRTMPEGYRIVSEIPGVMTNKYELAVIQNAVQFLESHAPLDFNLKRESDREAFLRYLDAFLIVAHPSAKQEKVFSEARRRLYAFRAGNQDKPELKSFVDLVQRISIQADQRKFSTATVLLSFLGRIKQNERTAQQSGTEPAHPQQNGTGILLGGDGKLMRVDYAGDANLPKDVAVAQGWSAGRSDFEAIQERLTVQPLIPIAGEGSRIYEPLAAANKILSRFIRIRAGYEKQTIEQLRRAGVRADLYQPEGSKYAYIAVGHVVAALNPGAKWIAGISTLAPLSDALPSDLPYVTQPVSPTLTESGLLDESSIGLGGHGEIMQKLGSDREMLLGLLENGVVPRMIQGDDVSDQETAKILSYYLRQGKASMVGTVTAQKIWFTGASAEEVREYTEKLKPIHALIEKSLTLGDDKQRDTWITALRRYEDEIILPAQRAGHKVNFYKGGILLRFGKTTAFVEASQLPAKIRLVDSRGASNEFSSDSFMALIALYFNTNNFAPDALIFAANRDLKIKEIYHTFLRQAHEDGVSPQQIMFYRREAEKQAARRLSEMSNEEWLARSWLIDRLRIALMGIPLEFKKGRWKLNQMAQQVASFEADLALSDMTADKISNLNDLEIISNSRLNLEQKNALIEGLGWSMSRSPLIPLDVKDIQLLLVSPDQFTQVKLPEHYPIFSETAAKRFEGIDPSVSSQALLGIALNQWLDFALASHTASETAAEKLRPIFLKLMNEEVVDDQLVQLASKLGAIVGQGDVGAPNRIGRADDPWQAIEEETDPRLPVKSGVGAGTPALGIFRKILEWFGPTATFALGAVTEGVISGYAAHAPFAPVFLFLFMVTSAIVHLRAGIFVLQNGEFVSVSWSDLKSGRAERIGISGSQFWKSYAMAMALSVTSPVGAVVAMSLGASLPLTMLAAVVPHLLNLVVAKQADPDPAVLSAA